MRTGETMQIPYNEVHILSCGHSRVSHEARLRGDTELCPRCMTYHEIEETTPGYAVSCGGCRFRRTYGATDLEARRAAAKHAHKFPTHRVMVRLGRRVLHVYVAAERNLQLPLDAPPF